MGSFQGALVRWLLRCSKIWNQPLADIRKSMEAVKADRMPEGILHDSVSLGGVECETFQHLENKPRKVILYFHGGGFCLGIYPSNRSFAAYLAKQTGANVMLPNYRLAPEHPYPAALDDAVAVYQAALPMAGNGLIVAGDSSGCALAVSALQVLRQSNQQMPELIGCITPVFDLAGKGETIKTLAKKDPFQMSDPLSVAKIYLGDQNPASPAISPLYGELTGLPPVLIHAAERDVFLSDSVRFARQAEAAGVPVRLVRWPGMWHIFHMQHRFVPEAREAFRMFCSSLNCID